MKDSKTPKTLSTEDKIALSMLDSVLDFCKTNGYQPEANSLSGKLFATIYAYVSQDPDKHYELWQKMGQVRQFPTYEKKQFKEAAETLNARRADANAVGIEKVFPRAKLVIPLFGYDSYQRMMATKNNEAAFALFAKYLDKALVKADVKPVDRSIAIFEYSVGIGRTPELDAKIDKCYKNSNLTRPKSSYSGWPTGALHPRDVAVLFGLSESGVTGIRNRLRRRVYSDDNLRPLFEMALKGDAKAMMDLLPFKDQQQIYDEFRMQYNIPDAPKDELNAVGKWLADNISLDR